MATQVEMQHKDSGEVKSVKVGWSWTLFLFSGFFGLPLFLRKLYIWGAVFLVLWVVNFIAPYLAPTPEEAAIVTFFMFAIFLGLQIWLGIKGNEMTAKNYLESGYVWRNPESDATKFAKGKWGLP